MSESSGLTSRIALLTLLQGLNHVPPLVAVGFASRALGSGPFGQYARLMSFAAVVALLANFAFQTTGVKLVAQTAGRNGDLSSVFTSVMAAKASVAAAVVIAVGAGLVFSPGYSAYFSKICMASAYGLALALTPTWFFVGLQRVQWLVLPYAAMRLGAACAVALLVDDSNDVLLYLTINALAEIVLMAWVIRQVTRTGVTWRWSGRESVSRLLVESRPIFGAALAINLYTASGPLVAGLALGNAATGQYALADRVRQLVLGAVGPVSQAVFPIACRAAVTRSPGDVGTLRRGLSLLLLVGLATTLFLWLFASEIVRIIGGAEFGPAADVLRSISVLAFLVTASGMLGTHLLIANGFSSDVTKIATLVAAVGVPFLYGMAKSFGLAGVSAALVATEVLALLTLLVVTARRDLLQSVAFRL